MSDRKKTPAILPIDPNYPGLESAKIQRRQFMVLMGGASAAAMIGCGPRHKPLPGAMPMPDQLPDAGSPPCDVPEITDLQRTAGVPPMPAPVAGVRLPAEGTALVKLKSGEEVSYTITIMSDSQSTLAFFSERSESLVTEVERNRYAVAG